MSGTAGCENGVFGLVEPAVDHEPRQRGFGGPPFLSEINHSGRKTVHSLDGSTSCFWKDAKATREMRNYSDPQ